ncbi:MarR family transcriptional regulator [Actinoplanes sp. NBRC 101535]|uniref:MarR family transcriptional regulator n=1 Tax=Actinoplanes TaxID=1865 RepID=UPI0014700D06
MKTDQPVSTPDARATEDDLLHRTAVLCRRGNRIRRHLERAVLRDAGLTWSSYDVLQLAVSHRPIDTRTIAEIAGVSKSTVTMVADALSRRGLVRWLRRLHLAPPGRLQVAPPSPRSPPRRLKLAPPPTSSKSSRRSPSGASWGRQGRARWVQIKPSWWSHFGPS